GLFVRDEAFVGLGPSVQAQSAALLQDLQGRHGLTYLVVSHDLPLVSVLADEGAILSEGHIVERGPAAALFVAPRHPATRALVEAVAALADLRPPPPAAALRRVPLRSPARPGVVPRPGGPVA